MPYIRALGVLMLAALPASAEEPFKFTSKRDDDRVSTKAEKDRMVIDVTSPFGISTLMIERTGDAWPEVVVVRLRLFGLEHFEARGGKVSIGASVQSHTNYKASVGGGKKEDPKDPESDYFLDFKMVGKDGKAATAIPNRDGYFEFRLPRPMFEGNPKAVTLEWVDFYRR